MKLVIQQTWTKLAIRQVDDKSAYCGEIAGIAINDNMGNVSRY